MKWDKMKGKEKCAARKLKNTSKQSDKTTCPQL